MNVILAKEQMTIDAAEGGIHDPKLQGRKMYFWQV